MHHCFFLDQTDLEIVFPMRDATDNTAPLIVFGWETGSPVNVVRIYITTSLRAVSKSTICVTAL